MEKNTIVTKTEGFTVRKMGDETLILDPSGLAIHVADEVGSFIYQQVDGIKSLTEILADILNAYDIDEKTAETDLMAFIDELESQKILGIRS